jgi:hypothetical protein
VVASEYVWVDALAVPSSADLLCVSSRFMADNPTTPGSILWQYVFEILLLALLAGDPRLWQKFLAYAS